MTRIELGGGSLSCNVLTYIQHRPLPIQIGIQWGHAATTELYRAHCICVYLQLGQMLLTTFTYSYDRAREEYRDPDHHHESALEKRTG